MARCAGRAGVSALMAGHDSGNAARARRLAHSSASRSSATLSRTPVAASAKQRSGRLGRCRRGRSGGRRLWPEGLGQVATCRAGAWRCAAQGARHWLERGAERFPSASCSRRRRHRRCATRGRGDRDAAYAMRGFRVFVRREDFRPRTGWVDLIGLDVVNEQSVALEGERMIDNGVHSIMRVRVSGDRQRRSADHRRAVDSVRRRRQNGGSARRIVVDWEADYRNEPGYRERGAVRRRHALPEMFRALTDLGSPAVKQGRFGLAPGIRAIFTDGQPTARSTIVRTAVVRMVMLASRSKPRSMPRKRAGGAGHREHAS